MIPRMQRYRSLLFFSFFSAQTIWGADEIEVHSSQAQTAMRSVVFAFQFQSLGSRPITIDSNAIVGASIAHLKAAKVAATWGHPGNQTDGQLLRAFLGTRLMCSAISNDGDEPKRVRVQSKCIVSRRELSDLGKPPQVNNTVDKVFAEIPNAEVIVGPNEVTSQVQSQIRVLLDKFIVKLKKNEFKTSLDEAYSKLK